MAVPVSKNQPKKPMSALTKHSVWDINLMPPFTLSVIVMSCKDKVADPTDLELQGKVKQALRTHMDELIQQNKAWGKSEPDEETKAEFRRIVEQALGKYAKCYLVSTHFAIHQIKLGIGSIEIP